MGFEYERRPLKGGFISNRSNRYQVSPGPNRERRQYVYERRQERLNHEMYKSPDLRKIRLSRKEIIRRQQIKLQRELDLLERQEYGLYADNNNCNNKNNNNNTFFEDNLGCSEFNQFNQFNQFDSFSTENNLNILDSLNSLNERKEEREFKENFDKTRNNLFPSIVSSRERLTHSNNNNNSMNGLNNISNININNNSNNNSVSGMHGINSMNSSNNNNNNNNDNTSSIGTFNQDVCWICLSDFSINGTGSARLPCNHRFHTLCIKRAFKGKKENRCPVCRNLNHQLRIRTRGGESFIV